MDNEEQKTPTLQVCTIHVGFPIESDEQAIEYKKKIAAVVADVPKARIDFSIIAAVPPPQLKENA